MSLNLKMLSAVLISSVLIVSCKRDKSTTYQSPVTSEVETENSATETEIEVGKIDAEGNYIYEVGSLFDLKLPNGANLNIGENSSENKFFKQLSNADFVVSDDKTQGWITLDRVYFASGKAEMTEVSDVQIKNIIEILKAFPT